MTESTTKIPQIKLDAESKALLDDVQYRLKKALGTKQIQLKVVVHALNALVREMDANPEWPKVKGVDSLGSADKGSRYSSANRPWHDRLELVLNDPEEAVGIQKSLEWAEKAVRSEALAGMMKRGRIKPLMKGTKVQIYGKGTHATRIRIASGEDIDIRGWMPTIHVR